jgi:hypothetical protein
MDFAADQWFFIVLIAFCAAVVALSMLSMFGYIVLTALRPVKVETVDWVPDGIPVGDGARKLGRR